MSTTPGKLTPARPSSTVILARDTAGGPELFMVQRHERSSFGAAYAFPGGVVDDSDLAVCDACMGRTPAGADSVLDTHNGIAYYVAAIRELFEETGVMLASCEASDVECARAREHINAGSLQWNAFVRESNMHLHCDSLHYFAHWITPDALPRRYTTRFFAARLPQGQSATHDTGELIGSRWITAANALDEGERGKMALHYPTVQTLRDLVLHDSVDGLIGWARTREAAGVETIYLSMSKREASANPFTITSSGK